MKQRLFRIFFLLSVFLIVGTLGTHRASAAAGTIDPVYKYAWGENIGWINFNAPSGNVSVTDTELTGHAWTQSYGWINLQPPGSGVKNDGQGNLSGSAWGEETGYIDFNGVTIDSDGFFHGYAEGSISGQVSFNCANTNTCGTSDFKTKTSWHGTGTILPPSHSQGGSASKHGRSTPVIPSLVANPLPLPPASSLSPLPPLSVAVPVSQCPSGKALRYVKPFLTKNVQLGSVESDVVNLQKFLNSHGYILAKTGIGSPGKESTLFGPLTRVAVILFQQSSGDPNILAELGRVGDSTRAAINKIAEGSSFASTTDVCVEQKVCPDYLTQYIKYGAINDATEVEKLQTFLVTYESAHIHINGSYDLPTFQAVRVFQNKYAKDILSPWQVTSATGYVYKTTEGKINQLYCSYKK